jgi:prepilin-type N-terminal cleavage/methylation domain-containing protein
VGERVLREESGFTLPEMLVTMMIMIIVLFALYSIFDMSLRVFSFGNDKVEAVENARLGLEKMEREIRAAYPYNKTAATPDKHLFDTWTSTAITFGNDFDGNRKIECPANAGECEKITYQLNSSTLQRINSSGGAPQPIVEFVSDVDGDGKALSFEYLDRNGNIATDEAGIYMVRIKLEVAVDRGIQDEPVTQILETEVALRNRSN